MSIKVMKQALEALNVCEQSDYGREWVWPETAHQTAMGNVREAITALRIAIEEAEKPEPELSIDRLDQWLDASLRKKLALPEWVGLTDEEIDAVTDTQWATNNHKTIYAAHRAYARAIEQRLKAKNQC